MENFLPYIGHIVYPILFLVLVCFVGWLFVGLFVTAQRPTRKYPKLYIRHNGKTKTMSIGDYLGMQEGKRGD